MTKFKNFSRNAGPISTKLGKKHPSMKEIQVRPHYFPMRNNSITKIKNIFLQNQSVNFNQTWHQAFLSKGDSRFFFQMKYNARFQAIKVK